MNNYIAFLDLLGIKDIAKYDPDQYFETMKRFRNGLLKSSRIFHKVNSIHSKVHFFSDSAFIETEDFIQLLEFLMDFRYEMNSQKYYFVAAVKSGTLGAENLTNDSEFNKKNIHEVDNLFENKDLFDKYGIYLSGTIFNWNDVSKVYVMQANFKGMGIYVDNSAIDLWESNFNNKFFYENEKSDRLKIISKLKSYNKDGNEEEKYEEKSDYDLKSMLCKNEFSVLKEKYLVNSFFFSSVYTKSVSEYTEVKLTKQEMCPALFTQFIERYHDANMKNKKFGRYYLTHLANWINSTNFSKKGNTIVKQMLISEEILINELARDAHCFAYIYFFLLNILFKQDAVPNLVQGYIKKIEKKLSRKYFNMISEIPNCILSMENKYRLVRDYQIHKINVSKNNKTKKNNKAISKSNSS